MESDTIAAISTPQGMGGIGIIKISGRKAVGIAAKLFSKRPVFSVKNPSDNKLNENLAVSHRLTHGYIVDPETNRVMDEVLLVVMKAPNSYTCEDVVEIQAHSGPEVLRTILRAVIDSGARLADPGEFTKRAFLNGRIDLTQAEAVAEVIRSKNRNAAEIATKQLTGEFRRNLETIIDELEKIHMTLEAAIEFSHEGIPGLDREKVSRDLKETIIEPIEEMIRNYEFGELHRVGLKIVIVGKPNVGKSSLMNRLLHRERAIVTEIPGTTRDAVEDFFSIEGIPATLVDTAGIRESHDIIEKVGMEKSKEYIEQADILLFVVDDSQGACHEDLKLFARIKGKKLIIVKNKIDLGENEHESFYPIEWRKARIVRTSAKYNRGINALIDEIKKYAVSGIGSRDIHEKIGIPNLRQKIGLGKALDDALRAITGLRENLSEEFIALDVKDAINNMGYVLGRKADENVMEQIFKNFCIGK